MFYSGSGRILLDTIDSDQCIVLKNRVKAILFDKDGTLLDFNRTWLPPYQEAADYVAALSAGSIDARTILADGGYLAETDTWRSDSLLASGSNQQIIQSWEALLDRRFSADENARISQIFTLNTSRYIAVLTPLRPCLQQLKDQGYVLGIATMDDEDHANNMAMGIGVIDLFDFICGADSGYGVKPEPGMVKAFADKLGLAVDQIAMVGDSPRDINMGINAGARLSIGVLTGAHSADELGKYTPHVLNDIGELSAYLQIDR